MRYLSLFCSLSLHIYYSALVNTDMIIGIDCDELALQQAHENIQQFQLYQQHYSNNNTRKNRDTNNNCCNISLLQAKILLLKNDTSTTTTSTTSTNHKKSSSSSSSSSMKRQYNNNNNKKHSNPRIRGRNNTLTATTTTHASSTTYTTSTSSTTSSSSSNIDVLLLLASSSSLSNRSNISMILQRLQYNILHFPLRNNNNSRHGIVDTIITNPPFGTKNYMDGIDLQFILVACYYTQHTVYAYYKSSTRNFIIQIISTIFTLFQNHRKEKDDNENDIDNDDNNNNNSSNEDTNDNDSTSNDINNDEAISQEDTNHQDTNQSSSLITDTFYLKMKQKQIKSIKVIAEMKFNLPNTYQFHQQKNVDIDVDLIRIEFC
jgi:predicted RNA methylase